MPLIREMQIGKSGVTDGFVQGLKNNFNSCGVVKISVLRSAREGKEDVKKISEEILDKLGKQYTAKVIGFTIAVKKWRKARE